MGSAMKLVRPADKLNAPELFGTVETLQLATNIRVNQLKDDNAHSFAEQLLEMSEGKVLVEPAA